MKHSQGFWRTRENGIYFRGTEEERPIFLRGTETILGNREYKKTKFERTEEHANLFLRNKIT